MKDINNFSLKPISQFTEDSTLYMQKQNNGYTYTFLLKFKSFSKGIVSGEILEIQPNYSDSLCLKGEYLKIGSTLSGKISKCYTFQKGYGCHWFKKEEIGWVCR